MSGCSDCRLWLWLGFLTGSESDVSNITLNCDQKPANPSLWDVKMWNETRSVNKQVLGYQNEHRPLKLQVPAIAEPAFNLIESHSSKDRFPEDLIWAGIWALFHLDQHLVAVQTYPGFDAGESLLNGIEVWRVRRQIK